MKTLSKGGDVTMTEMVWGWANSCQTGTADEMDITPCPVVKQHLVQFAPGQGGSTASGMIRAKGETSGVSLHQQGLQLEPMMLTDDND